jgi:hypothetical protein
MDSSTGRAGDRDEGVGGCSEPDRLAGADQDHRRRWPIEDGLARADDPEITITGLDGSVTLEDQHEALPVIGEPCHLLSRLESVDSQVRVVPAGRCGIDPDDQTVRLGGGRTAKERPCRSRARLAGTWLDPGGT